MDEQINKPNLQVVTQQGRQFSMDKSRDMPENLRVFFSMFKCFTSNRMQLQYLTCHTFKLTLNCEASIYFNGIYSTRHLL